MEMRKETLCAPAAGILCKNKTGGTFTVAFDDERDGDVVSPVGGVVTAVEKHGGRIALRTEGGMNVILEIGGRGEKMRTANTARQMCHAYVAPGDTVFPGQRLLHAELSRIRFFGGESVCVVTADGTPAVRRRETGERVMAGQTPVMDFV
ncbi:MAG: PTS glucose transporter subunit IIA [Clostridia bacterium]|nr:PTS glucose transporter subunit IIA [Clostridia bacterium]